ncbi:MAG: hypothetical protein KBC64_07270 [Simkaniaceae bacterium]|nr:hypothetical protein [Simkaniaceae bacterium]
MKKTLCALLIGLASLSASPHHVAIGPQSSNIMIKQNGGAGKQVGWITGGRVEYGYEDKLYVNGYIEKSWGTVKTYFVQDFWTEGTLGYIFSFKGKRLIPYAGIGYQFFKENQHLNDVSLGTHHPYIPVGIYLEGTIASMFRIGLNAKGLFSLKTLDHVGGFKGSYWQLKRRNDLVLEVPMTFHAEAKSGVWEVSLVPYYRVIRFGPSISVNSLGIPLNIQSQRNRYMGGRVMLAYAF